MAGSQRDGILGGSNLGGTRPMAGTARPGSASPGPSFGAMSAGRPGRPSSAPRERPSGSRTAYATSADARVGRVSSCKAAWPHGCSVLVANWLVPLFPPVRGAWRSPVRPRRRGSGAVSRLSSAIYPLTGRWPPTGSRIMTRGWPWERPRMCSRWRLFTQARLGPLRTDLQG